MLFICLDCRRIIGCANKGNKMQENCESCKRYDDCTTETPLNQPVGRNVFFIRFENGCEDHHKRIGFRKATK